VRWLATAGSALSGRPAEDGRGGVGGGRSRRSWRAGPSFGAVEDRLVPASGHRSRSHGWLRVEFASPAGRCRCPTRRSHVLVSCRDVVRCARLTHELRPRARHQAPTLVLDLQRSRTAARGAAHQASDRPRLRTAPFPVTGKGTCCWAPRAAASPRWWSGTRGS